LDREIRVGVLPEGPTGPDGEPLDGGYAQPAVAAVRFKRPSGRRTRLSRARLGKAVGVPRGADDPQGPNRPGAGGFARRPPGRGSWGLSLLKFGPSSPGAHAGSATYQGGTRPSSILWVPAGPQSAHRPRRPRRPAPVAAPRPECEVHRRVRRRLRRRGDQGAHYAGAGAAGGRLRRWPR
jgi:hypothetical protein